MNYKVINDFHLGVTFRKGTILTPDGDGYYSDNMGALKIVSDVVENNPLNFQLIKPKIEAGKWYKGNGKSLCYITNNNPDNYGTLKGYGFNFYGLWFDDGYGICNADDELTEVSEQEVKERLKNYVNEKYPTGTKFKDKDGKIRTLIGYSINTFYNSFYITSKTPREEWKFSYYSNPYIYDEGKWAKIVGSNAEEEANRLNWKVGNKVWYSDKSITPKKFYGTITEFYIKNECLYAKCLKDNGKQFILKNKDGNINEYLTNKVAIHTPTKDEFEFIHNKLKLPTHWNSSHFFENNIIKSKVLIDINRNVVINNNAWLEKSGYLELSIDDYMLSIGEKPLFVTEDGKNHYMGMSTTVITINRSEEFKIQTVNSHEGWKRCQGHKYFSTKQAAQDYLNSMKPKLKVNDYVEILTRPDLWSSTCSNKYPLNLDYPFKGKVLDVQWIRDRKEWSYNIGGYGFTEKSLNFRILEPEFIKFKSTGEVAKVKRWSASSYCYLEDGREPFKDLVTVVTEEEYYQYLAEQVAEKRGIKIGTELFDDKKKYVGKCTSIRPEISNPNKVVVEHTITNSYNTCGIGLDYVSTIEELAKEEGLSIGMHINKELLNAWIKENGENSYIGNSKGITEFDCSIGGIPRFYIYQRAYPIIGFKAFKEKWEKRPKLTLGGLEVQITKERILVPGRGNVSTKEWLGWYVDVDTTCGCLGVTEIQLKLDKYDTILHPRSKDDNSIGCIKNVTWREIIDITEYIKELK